MKNQSDKNYEFYGNSPRCYNRSMNQISYKMSEFKIGKQIKTDSTQHISDLTMKKLNKLLKQKSSEKMCQKSKRNI